MAHKNRPLIFIYSLFALLVTSPLAAQDIIPENSIESGSSTVVLRALDKITARITEIELEIGQEHSFGTLILKARYCRSRPPIETPETFAYLEIDDLTRQGERERIFEGWMMASSPALNPLEHPVYDVWVISCRISAAEADSGSR